MRQRESAEIQIRDSAKRRAGQHNQDRYITQKAGGQYNRNYNAVRSAHQRYRVSSKYIIFDGSRGRIVIVATQQCAEIII